ncbi:nicotinate-nucleotide adenylyltransferase [Metamycoplasma subdolum]|uniref:Probable nicotinate-nucleotide adenylyltransferase n=1 Tax=Metamycoplasma subdolum TaxID=92407 RepID=A0A3M0A4S2_9BACT|nr:nicotinate-nucleotide adenylyltransferase [Metamycoplasma subdolum]RMA78499.1 nicotinate-nucleotide adenylyltransferase [Metamycoplasma subdolum]WPB50431.1 nicotinate-nucleotide adenylyltransferase [Metamycoplasma subdolum]
MKIGLFGGSFNPIHKGHILLAKEAIEKLNLDKLIFIPANQNPFKKDENYIDGKHKLEMIKIVLEDKMEVSDFEVKRKHVSYTIDTVNHFKTKYPHDELFFLVGSDNVNKLNKWKDIQSISEKVQLVILERGNEYSKVNLKKYGCIKLKNKIFNFSSTTYRNGDFSQVEKEVQRYIGANWLYFPQIAKSQLSTERFKHLVFTAELAAKLAEVNKQSVRKAYQAGFMHDVAKEWSQKKQYSYLEKYGFDKENLESYKLHQLCAYYYLKNEYMYPEEDVLNAIKIHTTLAFELSELDKIVFVADKLCQGRKWNGIQKIREIALENLDEGLKHVILECCIKFNNEKGAKISEEQQKIYDKWLSY